jgi:glutaredoxin 3
MSFLRGIFGSSTKIGMENATKQVNQYIESNPVVVFSKTTCPFCASTKSLLKSLGVNANIVELNQTEGGSELQDALEARDGQRTVPNIYIQQEHIGGNSEIQSLSKSGKLEPKLKAAGVL